MSSTQVDSMSFVSEVPPVPRVDPKEYERRVKKIRDRKGGAKEDPRDRRKKPAESPDDSPPDASRGRRVDIQA